MGFEVILHYFLAKKDEPGWDQDEPQTKKHNIGHRNDECDYTKLARFCIAQYARRDIYVHNIEVFEFVKRKIVVKAANDSQGGVIIKGKKFNVSSLDSSTRIEELLFENEDDENPTPTQTKPTPPPTKTEQPLPTPTEYDFKANANRILSFKSTVSHPLVAGYVSNDFVLLPRWVIFQPSSPNATAKYKLTQARKYQVLGRFVPSAFMGSSQEGMKTVVIVEDDIGRIIKVPDIDMTPVPTGMDQDILADQRYDPDKVIKQQQLDGPEQTRSVAIPKAIDDDMIDIRRR